MSSIEDLQETFDNAVATLGAAITPKAAQRGTSGKNVNSFRDTILTPSQFTPLVTARNRAGTTLELRRRDEQIESQEEQLSNVSPNNQSQNNLTIPLLLLGAALLL